MTETEDRLETAMKNVKQAKVMLSEANCAINAAQAERAELRRENERLAKPQLPEGIEWPRFEDGELVKRPTPKVLGADGAPIEVGDTVWTTYGYSHQRVVSAVFANGSEEYGIPFGIPAVRYASGGWDRANSVTHERPDSWERIEEDAKLAPRDYLEKRGMNPEKTERIASMMADLVRRAKALAKAGEQG